MAKRFDTTVTAKQSRSRPGVLMGRQLLILLLLLVSRFVAVAQDDFETAKQTDRAQMKQIWEALQAFKKAKGEFPDHLHELFPKFLPDPAILISPLGPDKRSWARVVRGDHDPKLPSSYAYDYGATTYPGGDGRSGRVVTKLEMQDLGTTVPILRCFLYGPRDILNVSHAGDFFVANRHWESDPRTKPLFEKNGMGPGVKDGRKLVISLTDFSGKPLPGIPLRISDRPFGALSSGRLLPESIVTTDDHGHAALHFAPTAILQASVACATPEWFAPKQTWRGERKGDPSADLITVVAQPAGSPGGIVRDAQGKPLQGANVLFCKLDDPATVLERERLVWTSTDDQGRWAIPSAPRAGANLYLCVSHPAARTLFLKPSVNDSPGVDALFSGTSQIQLAAPIKVFGTILCEGQPVPGATVWLLSKTTLVRGIVPSEGTSNAAGYFELPAAEEGENVLGIFAKNFAPLRQSVQISANAAPLKITLDRGRRVKARLVQDRNGKVVGAPNQQVFFRGFPTWPLHMPHQALIGTTDETGRFTWDHAPSIDIDYTAFSEIGKSSTATWDPTKEGEALLELVYDFGDNEDDDE
jgi:hypothetical protein